METPIGLQLLLQLALIALNAVFACAEIAVISINDAHLEKMAASGDVRAVRLKRLTDQPARFLATIQVAITLSGFLGSAFAADYFAELISDWALGIWPGASAGAIKGISVVLVTLLLSYLTLVLGELVPKRVAMRNAEKLALRMSGMITAISKVFKPIVWALTVSTNGVLRLMGIDPNAEEEPVTEEEIRMMVDVGSEKGAIDPEEKEMIQNVFEFDDMTAGELATHRVDVCLICLDDDPDEWEKTITETSYTYYPVCAENADDITGIISARDYLLLEERTREAVEKITRPAYFVPDGVKADVLFRNMKITHNQFAIVLDEFGGMEGIITINDLIEELVGELDGGKSDITFISDNLWRIDGGTLIDDIRRELNVSMPDCESDTLSGLVFSHLGTIPEDGASVELKIGDVNINVTDIREHRVQSALVSKNLDNPATA